MKVVLITQGVSPAVWPLLREPGIEIVGIVESAPRGYESQKKGKTTIRRRLRNLMRPRCHLAGLAACEGLPYLLLHRNNSRQLQDWLRRLEVDVVVVSSMSQLLGEEVIKIPRLGALNLHPSLLPAYRGANPWFWVYYNDERFSGVTLHFINPDEDAGDIVAQHEFNIERGSRLPDLVELAVGQLGVKMVLEALRALARGESLPRRAQCKESPTPRARNIQRSEYPGLVAWKKWDVERVWHFLRGTEAMLPALEQTILPGGKLWEVGEFERSAPDAHVPGKIQSENGRFFVGCRNGRVELKPRSSGWERFLKKICFSC